ncbi:recombination protein RecT [Corticibacter populi]|uniref:Recombination protein RecT n=1 Tax=Corticibacter populi TaxID=1550736 RepID=A0A3M6QZS9_9BURK|nr:recombination protein RecT [Corticibacter populi]RMX08536.1 recombination protein RecT [Corticibacter populi]RZS35855.1 recombination protein RecT [Corticibacter populi]
MSTQALKAAATGAVATAKPQTLATLITADSMKKQFAAALPKHMTPDRFTRVALTELRKVPKLMQADPQSFMGAIMQCAQLGIEPGGALGHAYLLPFENRRTGKTEVQFILGYKGMIDLARRSGKIVSIEARAVYERDEFSVTFGLNPDLQHNPAWEDAERGDLRAVYAVAKLQGGGVQFEVMGRAEVERIMRESQGWKAAEATARKYNREPNSPWHTHFDEMAKKTVLRRLFKYLPVSVEYVEAQEREDRDSMMADIELPADAVYEVPSEQQEAIEAQPTVESQEEPA